MEAFWKWLLKANARGVLICSVLALVAVTSWWTWRELRPIEQDETALPSPNMNELDDSLGLLALLPSADSTTNPPAIPTNPFVANWMQHRPPQTNTVPRWKFRLPKPKPPTVIATPPPTDTGPKFEEITVVFQGLLTRTDGKTLALIRDSKRERVAFYAEGSDLLGFAVTSITSVAADMLTPEGEPRTLRINEPQTFRVRIP